MAAMALEGIAQAIQSLGAGQVKIDTGAFSLHYRATTTVFVAFGGLLYTTMLMVSPLQCQPATDPAAASTAVINSFCWSTGTYTLPPPPRKGDQLKLEEPAEDLVAGSATIEATGARKLITVDLDDPDGPRGLRRHNYYSWASFLLIMQGLLFYLPHWLWHFLEGRKVAAIVQDPSNRMAEKEHRYVCLENVAQYLRRTKGQHTCYYIIYIFCEVLNFANVIGNIFLIDAYLGGGFLGYGARIMSYRRRGGPGPMDGQFPKMTGCRITIPSADGSPSITDTVCVLSMNALYEKVYLLLWIWLVCLVVFSGGSLLVRIADMLSGRLRAGSLQRRAPLSDPEDLVELVDQFGRGDLFLLSLIAENIDSGAFQRLAAELVSGSPRRRATTEDASRSATIKDGSAGIFKRPESTVSPMK